MILGGEEDAITLIIYIIIVYVVTRATYGEKNEMGWGM